MSHLSEIVDRTDHVSDEIRQEDDVRPAVREVLESAPRPRVPAAVSGCEGKTRWVAPDDRDLRPRQPECPQPIEAVGES